MMGPMPEHTPATQPRSLSGMQPTSDSLHLCNYIGALVNWVELQERTDAFYFVADLHAQTVPTDPADITRAHDVLGWEPRSQLEDGLVRTIAYFTGDSAR